MNFLDQQREVISNIADQSLVTEVKGWINKIREDLCQARSFNWMVKTRTFPISTGVSSYTFDGGLATNRFSGVWKNVKYVAAAAGSTRVLSPRSDFEFDRCYPYVRASAPDNYKVLGDTFYLDAIPATLTDIKTPVNSAFVETTGTLAAGTYYYRVSATLGGGESLASTETDITVTGGSNGVVVNWTKVDDATGYKVYGRASGLEQLIASVADVSTYTDTGSITPSGSLPTATNSKEHLIAAYYALPNSLSNPNDEEYIDKKYYQAIIAGATLRGFIQLRANNEQARWDKIYRELAKTVEDQNNSGPREWVPVNIMTTNT